MNWLSPILLILSIIPRVFPRSVEVILQAHWSHYSLLAQAGEFYFDVDPHLFWKFSNFVTASCKENSTDEDDFHCALQYCSLYLSFGYCDLLSFSLGLNYYSPRIHMYQQIAEEVNKLIDDSFQPYNICNVFVVLCDNYIICNSNDIYSYLPIDVLNCNISVLPFDHKSTSSQYSQTNYTDSFSAIVYGPFGNKVTLEFFELINNLIQMGYLAGFIYRPWYKSDDLLSPLLLSGYGVELAIKSTEYRVVDDSLIPHHQNSGDNYHIQSETELDGLKFHILNSIYDEHSLQLSLFQHHLIEMQNDFVPLKQWQLTDLGIQICQWLLNTFPNEAIDKLYGLSKLVQNLPVDSKHLYLLDVTDGLRREIVFNQRIFTNIGIESGQCLIFFNGRTFNEFEPFSLISFIKGELFLFANIKSLGISPNEILKILSFRTPPEDIDYGIDTRHKCVVFVNNIEADLEYMSWTDNIQDLLRPTFPGVIRQVRRNFFNLLICFDPFDPTSYSILKSANYFLTQNTPITIALLIVSNNHLDKVHVRLVNVVSCLFSELKSNASSRIAFNWLLEICKQLYYTNGTLSFTQIRNIFETFSGMSHKSIHVNCSVLTSLSEDFISSRGLSHFPKLFLNGIPLALPIDHGSNDLFIDKTISIIKEGILDHTRIFQRDIYFGSLRDPMNILDYIMTKSNIVRRLNYRILARNHSMIDFFCLDNNLASWFDKLSSLAACKIHQVFARETPYIISINDHHLTRTHSVWLIADFSSELGFEFLFDCLRMLSTSERTRVGLIFNYDPTVNFNMNHFLHTLIFSQPLDNLFNLIMQLQIVFQQSIFTMEGYFHFFSSVEGFNERLFLDFFKSDEFYITGFNYLHYSSKVLKVPRGMRGIVSNGQYLGHLLDYEHFNFEDFLFLNEFTLRNLNTDLLKLVDKYEKFNPIQEDSFNLFNKASSPERLNSDLLLYLFTIVVSEVNVERISFPIDELLVKYSTIRLKPKFPDEYSFSIHVVVDPVSKEAQKLLPISIELYNTFNIDLHVWLSPRERLSEIPINRFYKYLIFGKPIFDRNGFISHNSPNIEFLDLPKSPLLNLLLDTPHVWMVEPIKSEYDLDNLDMKSGSKCIQAIFKLSHILLEGHCWLHSTNEPVPGIQFSLGTMSEPKKLDSVVMANLGYFQFKVTPGLWKLQLLEWKSDASYYISESKGNNFSLLDDVILIFSDNFLGTLLQVFLKKKDLGLVSKLTTEENYNEELIEKESTLESLWNSVSNLLPSVKKSMDSSELESSNNVINIFSIASGHLYERFLRIMVLSIIKHSKSPVKFWILKQYLSPSFMESFPIMALTYNFTFEFVNYKWPKWLRKQDQKQREIWGYKILFLDVLFPMHVKRIIYVDADQIIRSDLLELVHMNLNHSPYGYTPFCDSRTEMDGYRFWKHGYWQNLLGNNKYHISALYVVDLFRFRDIGAGDKLRGNYQALSQDPNSLANLDQDLPNSMIHSVPIFSLPQDWLWCETWCSDKDKMSAKTIDICNNPLTKEPKLVAAKRIVGEWNEYDTEIKNLIKGMSPTNPEFQEVDKQLVHSEF